MAAKMGFGWPALALLLIAQACARSIPLLPGATDSVQRSQDGSQREFDYFMFVREWPGGYCSEHTCSHLHVHGFQFTIHGLWPNYNDGTWPQFCNADFPFREGSITDLEDEMDQDWPSFMGANADFWAHEWDKHGTCAMRVLHKEHAFFRAVLKLNYKLDLSAAFRAAGIMPSRKRTYARSVVLDAIYSMYGVDAQLHCTPDGDLQEVWMCVDKDLHPFTCKRSATSLATDDHCAHVRIPPALGMSESAEWVSPLRPSKKKHNPTEIPQSLYEADVVDGDNTEASADVYDYAEYAGDADYYGDEDEADEDGDGSEADEEAWVLVEAVQDEDVLEEEDEQSQAAAQLLLGAQVPLVVQEEVVEVDEVADVEGEFEIGEKAEGLREDGSGGGDDSEPEAQDPVSAPAVDVLYRWCAVAAVGSILAAVAAAAAPVRRVPAGAAPATSPIARTHSIRVQVVTDPEAALLIMAPLLPVPE